MIEESSSDKHQQDDAETTKTIPVPLIDSPAVPHAPTVEPRPLPEQVVGETANQTPQNPPDDANKPMTPFERKMMILTLVGIGLAAVTAALFYVQLNEMQSQTQILASQSEGANAGALMDEMNTRNQLGIVKEQADAAQKQAKAAQDSANAIQRQTEIGSRPWLELSEIALTDGMRINAKGEANSLVHIVATNIGKTPAREVGFWAELGERYNEHQEIQRMCTMETGGPKGAGKYGQVLFPTKKLGEKENRVITIKLKPLTLVSRTGKAESTRIDKNGPPSSQEESIYSIPSSVIGCIQYKSFTSDVPYYTGFIYEFIPPAKGMEMFGYNIHFDRKTGKASDLPPTISQESGTVTIPLEWLRLAPNFGWGNDIVK